MFARFNLNGIVNVLDGSLDITLLHEQICSILVVHMIIGAENDGLVVAFYCLVEFA